MDCGTTTFGECSLSSISVFHYIPDSPYFNCCAPIYDFKHIGCIFFGDIAFMCRCDVKSISHTHSSISYDQKKDSAGIPNI